MLKFLPRRNRTEWITFAIALMIVSLLIGLIIHIWISEDNQPPLISVTATPEIFENHGQFYVPFTVTNIGGGTAESVQVIGELALDGEVVESGEQVITFLSKNEEEEGMFIFTRNPRQGDLTVRAASYALP